MTESKSIEASLAEAFQKADAFESSLEARLEFYLGESRKLLPDLETSYDELVARLKSNEAKILVPGVGERADAFVAGISNHQRDALLRRAVHGRKDQQQYRQSKN